MVYTLPKKLKDSLLKKGRHQKKEKVVFQLYTIFPSASFLVSGMRNYKYHILVGGLLLMSLPGFHISLITDITLIWKLFACVVFSLGFLIHLLELLSQRTTQQKNEL